MMEGSGGFGNVINALIPSASYLNQKSFLFSGLWVLLIEQELKGMVEYV